MQSTSASLIESTLDWLIRLAYLRLKFFLVEKEELLSKYWYIFYLPR